MFKKIMIIFIVIFMVGCTNENIIDKKNNITVSYPVTNIGVLDNAISSYINNQTRNFKKNKMGHLDISYTYKDIGSDIINISIVSEMDNTAKVKTFTYNKKTEKFLAMEDIVSDTKALDYEVRKKLIDKYQDKAFKYLSNITYNNFKLDDKNLTVFLNQKEEKANSNILYLDIPLDTLDLLIDVKFEVKNDIMFSMKSKNISENDKVVALTFDDGPSKYTAQILDILKKYKACATFFVVGEKARFQGSIIRRALKEGNEIGNHSYSHKKLTRLSESEFKNEVNKTQEIVKNISGYTPKLFRPTYGGYTNKLKSYTDLKFVLWDVDSKDWLVKNKDKIFKNITDNVKSGSIILMHDNHVYAALALEEVIEHLKEEGYKFVTVSELLEIVELRKYE